MGTKIRHAIPHRSHPGSVILFRNKNKEQNDSAGASQGPVLAGRLGEQVGEAGWECGVTAWWGGGMEQKGERTRGHGQQCGDCGGTGYKGTRW